MRRFGRRAGVRSGPLNAYYFADRWYVDAPIEEVWPVIRDLAAYPQWWSEFVEAQKLNDIDGVGGIIRVHAKAALPYHMYFEVEAVREEPPRVAESRVRGDLNGEMRWTLSSEGSGTRLVFEETVVTGKALLNVLAPLFKPLFAWNHRAMMRSGQQGLRRFLVERRATGPAAQRRGVRPGP